MQLPHFNTWISFIAGIFLMSISGTIYMFPAYAQDLRLTFNYTTEETNFIGTMANVGTWTMVAGGFFYDSFGPRLTGFIGALMIFSGYFLMFISTLKVFEVQNWLLGIFAFVLGQGSGWTYTTALTTSVMNFKAEHRGKIVGSLATFFGLCSGIYTRYYSMFVHDGDVALHSFFLFLAIVLASIAVVGSSVSNVVKEKIDTGKRIYITYGLAAVLGTVVAVSSIVQSMVGDLDIDWYMVCLFVLLILGTQPLVSWGTETVDDEMIVHDKEEEVEAKSYTLLEALKMREYYLLFISLILLIGAGITILNNLSAIIISKEVGIDPKTSIKLEDLPFSSSFHTFVVLFSTSNTMGRMLIGFISDKFSDKLNRVTWMVIYSIAMGLTSIMFMFISIPLVFPGIIILGLVYGGIFCLAPTITSELFGLKHLGANYGLMTAAPAIGSEIFSVLLAGKLADWQSAENYVCVYYNHASSCNQQCLGATCYLYTLIITTIGCGIAAVLSFYLSRRVRNNTTTEVMIPINLNSDTEDLSFTLSSSITL